MLFNKSEILESLNSNLIKHSLEEIEIDEVVIDSRKAKKNSLFICIKGDYNNGHNYIDQALNNGCKAILIHEECYFEKYQNLILVKNTFDALNQIAKFSRSRSQAKIIGVTGSMGKTTTKEIIKTVLSSQGKVYSTFGNLNNHYGVPLTLANMPQNIDFAIIELAMNHAGEICELSKLTKPHIAIITGITSAHIENFDNESQIALAKSEIFQGLEQNGIAIINNDNNYFDLMKAEAIKNSQKVISFGQNINSDYYLQDFQAKSKNSSLITFVKDKQEFKYEVSSINNAIIKNSLIALICLDLVAKNLRKGIESLKNIKSTKGRANIIEIDKNNKNITIIDDSYNANLASMKSGIDYLLQLKSTFEKTRAIAVLGDIFELGDKSQEIHQELLIYLNSKNIDQVFLVGPQFEKSSFVLLKPFLAFKNSEIAAGEIAKAIKDRDIMLVKGSRAMKMEKVIEKIQI